LIAADALRPHLLMPGTYPDWDMQALEQDYTVLRLWEAADQAAFLAKHAPAVRAVATRGDLGAAAGLLAQLPALEIISCYGVGTDAIAVDIARSRGIAVTNTPDVLTGDVADLAAGLALALLRRIPAADSFVRSGVWPSQGMPLASRLHGKRAGIAGMGRIGAATARRLAAFDMSIGYFSRQPKADSAGTHFTDLAALADWCDVLVVTLPGGAATANIVDAQVLQALGPQGWLVNVARGSTVDEAALLQALEARSIAGAALDVFWNEPRIDTRFLALDNVVLQPHLGSATTETRRAMGQLVRDNLAAHFAGRPLITPLP
jgi:D-3-phosphoglycerate dehydrogenase